MIFIYFIKPNTQCYRNVNYYCLSVANIYQKSVNEGAWRNEFSIRVIIKPYFRVDKKFLAIEYK